MSRLGPYNQRQIDGDFVLTELQKIYKKINPGFKLTPRYNAFGDSYGAGDRPVSWVNELNNILGTVANNQCVSGGTIIEMAILNANGIRNNVALFNNPDFDCSTICMHGVNDSRNTNPFFNYYPNYYNTALASYLLASIPQSGLLMGVEGTVVSGTWSDGTLLSDKRTSEINAKLSAQLSGRFLAFFYLVKGDTGAEVENNNNPWKISVDGVLESDITKNYYVTMGNANGFYMGVRVIDTRIPKTTKLLLVENMDTMVNTKFVMGFGGWDADSPLARNVLVLTPTITNGLNITNGADLGEAVEFDAKHLRQKNAQIAAVRMCQSLGLPVFIHDTPYETEYSSDALHLNLNGIKALATKIVPSIGSFST